MKCYAAALQRDFGTIVGSFALHAVQDAVFAAEMKADKLVTDHKVEQH